MAKNVSKLKARDKATFYSLTEPREMLAPSSKKPEELEFVVDSAASMHMLCKKVLRSAELEPLRKSRNPTIVITANGEVRQVRKHRKTFTILIGANTR